MTSERLFNSFIPPKTFIPPKQISGYAPDTFTTQYEKFSVRKSEQDASGILFCCFRLVSLRLSHYIAEMPYNVQVIPGTIQNG